MFTSIKLPNSWVAYATFYPNILAGSASKYHHAGITYLINKIRPSQNICLIMFVNNSHYSYLFRVTCFFYNVLRDKMTAYNRDLILIIHIIIIITTLAAWSAGSFTCRRHSLIYEITPTPQLSPCQISSNHIWSENIPFLWQLHGL